MRTSQATVIDFHEKRIQKLQRELGNATDQQLYERIQKLTHSERAMKKLMKELGLVDEDRSDNESDT